MHLGHSCPIPIPQFAAFSLIININNDKKNQKIIDENARRNEINDVNDRTDNSGNENFDFMMHREMLLVASPVCTISQHTATSNISELNKFWISKMTKNVTFKKKNEKSSAFSHTTEGIQIYRSKHGIALYHKIIQDPAKIREFYSFLSSMQIFNIPDHVAAIVLCAGFTGIPILHGSSNLINNISKNFSQTLFLLMKLPHKLRNQRNAQTSSNKSNNNNNVDSHLDINEDDLKQKAKLILSRLILDEDDLMSNTEASINFDISITQSAELPVYSKLTPTPLVSLRLSQQILSQTSLPSPSLSSLVRKLPSSRMTAVAQSTQFLNQMQILAISERDMDLKPDRRINRTKHVILEDESFTSGESSLLPELHGFDVPYSSEEMNTDNVRKSIKNMKPTMRLTLPPPRRSSVHSSQRRKLDKQINKMKSPPDILGQSNKLKIDSYSQPTSSSYLSIEKKKNFRKKMESSDINNSNSRPNGTVMSSQQIDKSLRNSVNHIQKDSLPSFQISDKNKTPPISDWTDLNYKNSSNGIATTKEDNKIKNQLVGSDWQWQNFGENSEDIKFSEKDTLIPNNLQNNNMNDNEHFNRLTSEIEYGTEKTVASGKDEYDDPSISTVDTATPSDGSAVPFPTLLLNVALNEDLACSYENGRISSSSIEGTIQVRDYIVMYLYSQHITSIFV